MATRKKKKSRSTPAPDKCEDSSPRHRGDDDCEFQLVFSIQEDPASRETAVPALIAHRRLKERLWWKTRDIDQFVNLGHPGQSSPPDSEAFLPDDFQESPRGLLAQK